MIKCQFCTLRLCLPGLFDCTFITTDKPLLTLALPITNYKFPFLKCLETISTTWKYKQQGFIWRVTPKAKGFRPQTLKLVKTWIPFTPLHHSFCGKLKGKGSLVKVPERLFSELLMRVAVLLSLAVLIKFFVFPSSLLNVHFATRYFTCSLKTLFCLWLDISFFFWRKKRQETLCGYYLLEVDSSSILNG